MSIRILIADDHPIVLQGLISLLSTEPDIQIVDTCRDGAEVLEALGRVAVDVLLVDQQMPGLTGTGVMQAVMGMDPKPHFVLLTANLDDRDALEAVRLGARAVILKEEAPRNLIETLRAVARGERRVADRLLEQVLGAAMREEAERKRPVPRLTPAESRIVALVGQGLPNKLIARELGITEATVKIHLHRIFRKVGVNNRVQLTLQAQQRALA